MPLMPFAQAATIDPTSSCVRFAMKDGSKVIRVMVSGPALENISIAPQAHEGYFGTFKLYRRSFEMIASRKYAMGHLEPDGTVCIRALDVPPPSAS